MLGVEEQQPVRGIDGGTVTRAAVDLLDVVAVAAVGIDAAAVIV